MPDTIDEQKIIESNPAVDPDKLAEMRELLRKKREGRTGRGYKLASPVERRRVIVGEDESTDPRTVHLDPRKK